jgi:signal transduction histidine kinase
MAQEVCDLVRGSSPLIEVTYMNSAARPPVMGDPTRLHQLLMNLCTNAVHAMEDGGTLDVAHRPARLKAPLRRAAARCRRASTCASRVEDSGHGIAPR